MRGLPGALVVETPASLGPLPRAAAAFIAEKRREEDNDADDDDESMTSKSKAKSNDFQGFQGRKTVKFRYSSLLVPDLSCTRP